jgi:predicted nucleic acid-binding protein
MNVYKVGLATNVLVSGLRSKRGASYKLLTLLDRWQFTPAVSVPLVVEHEKALVDSMTKVPFSPSDIGKFMHI